MGKFTHDAVLEAALAKLATATRQTLASAQPADLAGLAAVALAYRVLTPGAGNGDFLLADGDTSGRKLTVVAKAGVLASASGDATHLCLDDGATLLHVTPTTLKYVTSGNVVDVPAYDIEFLDVTP